MRQGTNLPDRDSFFDMRVGERTRELLENFDVVGTLQYLAIVPRGEYLRHLRENVRAAIVASTLNLQSLDYAKRRYCDSEEDEPGVGGAVGACIDAYQTSKSYVSHTVGKLKTQGRPEPSMGVFGASLVLERLLPIRIMVNSCAWKTGRT